VLTPCRPTSGGAATGPAVSTVARREGMAPWSVATAAAAACGNREGPTPRRPSPGYQPLLAGHSVPLILYLGRTLGRRWPMNRYRSPARPGRFTEGEPRPDGRQHGAVVSRGGGPPRRQSLSKAGSITPPSTQGESRVRHDRRCRRVIDTLSCLLRELSDVQARLDRLRRGLRAVLDEDS
jgi:hypothetical protein